MPDGGGVLLVKLSLRPSLIKPCHIAQTLVRKGKGLEVSIVQRGENFMRRPSLRAAHFIGWDRAAPGCEEGQDLHVVLREGGDADGDFAGFLRLSYPLRFRFGRCFQVFRHIGP